MEDEIDFSKFTSLQIVIFVTDESREEVIKSKRVRLAAVIKDKLRLLEGHNTLKAQRLRAKVIIAAHPSLRLYNRVMVIEDLSIQELTGVATATETE